MHAHRTALVMITRNEARCIARSLRSMRPWVDEMIVLDTGSTDETTRIAAEEGARVAHFRWVDDFSAARNAALDMSHADWNIVVDADEHLVAGGEVLASLRQTAPDFLGRLEQFNAFQISHPAGSSTRTHSIQLAATDCASHRAIHRHHTRATSLGTSSP